MEEETGEVQVQAKDCQQAAESRRETGDEVLFRVSRKSPNLATLWFWTLAREL